MVPRTSTSDQAATPRGCRLGSRANRFGVTAPSEANSLVPAPTLLRWKCHRRQPRGGGLLAAHEWRDRRSPCAITDPNGQALACPALPCCLEVAPLFRAQNFPVLDRLFDPKRSCNPRFTGISKPKGQARNYGFPCIFPVKQAPKRRPVRTRLLPPPFGTTYTLDSLDNISTVLCGPIFGPNSGLGLVRSPGCC